MLSRVEVIQYGIYETYGAALGDREKALADIRTAIWEAALLYPVTQLVYRVTPMLYQRTIRALRELLDGTWAKHRGREVEERDLSEEPNDEIDTPAVNPYELIDKALEDGRIRPEQKTMLLRHSEGKKDREIGEELGLSEETVKKRRQHAAKQVADPNAPRLRGYTKK